MLKELSWYIETNRFTDIVEEMEEKAAAYSNALKADSGDKEERREELRSLCQWHMEKSGYKAEAVPYINVDLEFFNGDEINRPALNTFEKEIIKAHMYQKHLWEFMGTTESMTVISKSAMKKDGFDYDRYLPLEYRKTHKAKSPVSGILEENPESVPFYIYPDGTVSSEYDPEKSKGRFDVLKDRSGFDWAGKGWDPNYEVVKDGWHGEFDENGIWTMVQEKKRGNEKPDSPGIMFEELPEIEILKDGENAILYDPQYSLISTFERVFLLTDGDIYGAEREDAEKTAELIKKAVSTIGATSIKAVCGGRKKADIKKLNGDFFDQKAENITDGRILSFYKRLLGETLEDTARLTGYEEYRKIRKELTEKSEAQEIERQGRILSGKIAVIKPDGSDGKEIISAVQSGKTKVPLSVFSRPDKKEAGFTDDEFNIIQNYAVPENKRELFSKVILNLLQERKTIAASGKEVREFFDGVYADVVQGRKSDETITIETTFSELCSNPEKSLGCEPVESAVIEKLLEAKKNLPEQKTPELQKKVLAAVDNVIRNFSAVRMSTGMTPEEAVKLAVRCTGGKGSSVFVPPVSGIVYQKPVRNGNGSVQDGSDRRIFSDIKISDLIERAKNLPAKTKEIEVERLLEGKSYGQFPDLFNTNEREEWYRSEGFKKTGLSVSDAEGLIRSEEERIRKEITLPAGKDMIFSVNNELDGKFGYGIKSRAGNKNILTAKIEPATKSLSAENVVRKLSEGAEMVHTASFKAAEIKPDGRLSRELAGAVNMAGLVRELKDAKQADTSALVKEPLNSVGQALDLILKGRSDEVVISGTAGNTEGGAFLSDSEIPAGNTRLPEEYIEKTSALRKNGDTGRNRGPFSSLENVNVPDRVKAKISPEQEEAARLERMNANYEHDRTVLAKTDPLFAKDEMRNVGNAEGSGEKHDKEKVKKDTKLMERLIDSKLKKQGRI